MHTYLVSCTLFDHVLVQNLVGEVEQHHTVHCYDAHVDIHIFAEFIQNHNYSTLIQTLILSFQILPLT